MRAALQNHVGQSAAATGVNQSSVPQIINIHKWPGVTSAQHLDPTRTHRRSRIWRLIFMKGLKDTANTGAGTTYLTLCMCLCVCVFECDQPHTVLGNKYWVLLICEAAEANH